MEKINMYKKKVTEEKEIELKQDFIVPDSKQDIFQIKETNFYCYLNKIEILNGKIKVNGNVDSYLSYLSSSEETIGLQTTFSFEDYLENHLITEKMNLQYNIEIQKQEIKIVNERKINISIILKIEYEVYGIENIEIMNDFSDIEDVQINSKKIFMSSLVGMNSGLANVKEEIKIDNTDLATDILKFNTEILNKEIKISHNKILTKADLVVSITYLTKDERICEVEEKFPLMSFIDMENIKEDNTCSTDYQVRNVLLNINNGEENSIAIQIEYEIFCKAFESKEQEIVSDLYSLKCDIEFLSKEIEITDNDGNIENVNIVQNVTKKDLFPKSDYSMVVYTVKKNDSLWNISKKFKVKQENIINSNQLEEPYYLKSGEKIYIVR